MKSPCCNAKPTKGPGNLKRCPKCGGYFDPREIASGQIEGGDYDDRRPDARLLLEESGGPGGRPIKRQWKLKGGL